MASSSQRLDAFTDAAFAFSITMVLTLGVQGSFATSEKGLLAFARNLPAFAVCFAFMALFWNAHVRWRRHRGEDDVLATLLTLLLIFMALVYAFPLAAMANSLIAVAFGAGKGFDGSIGRLFGFYGFGFAVLAGTTAALFANARRNTQLNDDAQMNLRGETIIWAILAMVGAISMFVGFFGGSVSHLAPWIYVILPFAIGIFAYRWKWAKV